MTEIIPAIIAQDFQELKRKYKLVESSVGWIHIDVMDGKFVPFETWAEPKKLKELKTFLKIESHLMVSNPLKEMEGWLKMGTPRIILHWESLKLNPEDQLKKIIQKVKRFNCQIGVALNPETSWREIDPLLGNLDLVLLMGVKPGRAGQVFQERILLKIRTLREAFPELNIEVDGGVKPGNARKIIEAGANILAVGSAIFEAENPKGAIEKFRASV